MTLEDLIYKRLTEDEALAKLLARFNGTPAIAYQTAPQDEDRGWDGKRQYPRMDYIVDMQANPERGSSGVLTINIWCDEKGHPPEDIEPVVRAALQDILIKPDGSYPYNLGWARTDAFEQTRSLSGRQTLALAQPFCLTSSPSRPRRPQTQTPSSPSTSASRAGHPRPLL